MTLALRIAIVTAMFAWIEPAVAQQYPMKSIRLMIPSPPGGGTDTLGRILKEGLTELWGQPIVVDNRGGASGRIAAAAVAKASPDGYTLFFTYGGVLTTGLPLFRKLAYDPMRDFQPIAMMAHVPSVLVAHPSFQPKTLAEIIKLARAKPGALTHGSSSIGSSSHLGMELLKQMAGIDVLLVSFNGDAPLLTSLLGGHVQFAFNNVVSAWAHIQSGKLKPIAVATAQRVPTLPDVPTIAESGLPGYESLLFYLLVGPAKMPMPIVMRLNEAAKQIKQSPAVRQQLATLGAIPVEMTPSELGDFLKRDLEKWTKVITAGGIKAE